MLAPNGSSRWCAGTFRGQVLHVLVEPCPAGKLCPAILAPPQVIGTFTFRVTRG